MKGKFKPWQRWVLFALAMAVIFASGVIISFLMEHSAEVVNVDYKKKIKSRLGDGRLTTFRW